MMWVQIRDFRLIEQPAYIRGVVHLATFTAHMNLFKIYRVQAMKCPERGLMIWGPTQIRLSMEGRDAIKVKVAEKLKSLGVVIPDAHISSRADAARK